MSVKIRYKIKKRNIGWSFTLLLASGQCIMGLQIMKSIGYWDQIYPDWQVPNYSFVLYVCGSSFPYYYHSVIRITLFQSQSNPLKRLPLYLDGSSKKPTFSQFFSVIKSCQLGINKPFSVGPIHLSKGNCQGILKKRCQYNLYSFV